MGVFGSVKYTSRPWARGGASPLRACYTSSKEHWPRLALRTDTTRTPCVPAHVLY